MKATLLEEGDQGVGLDSTGFYDQEIYGGSDSRFAGYVTSIAANEQEEVVHQLISHVYLPLFPSRWCTSYWSSLTSIIIDIIIWFSHIITWFFGELDCSHLPVAYELGESCRFGEIWLDSCFSFFSQDDEEDSATSLLGQKKPGYHAPVAILNAIPQSDEQVCANLFCNVRDYVCHIPSVCCCQ